MKKTNQLFIFMFNMFLAGVEARGKSLPRDSLEMAFCNVNNEPEEIALNRVMRLTGDFCMMFPKADRMHQSPTPEKRCFMGQQLSGLDIMFPDELS